VASALPTALKYGGALIVIDRRLPRPIVARYRAQSMPVDALASATD
jgi:hypothetical protein